MWPSKIKTKRSIRQLNTRCRKLYEEPRLSIHTSWGSSWTQITLEGYSRASKTITQYKQISSLADNNPSLPDLQNHYYNHFDKENTPPIQCLPPIPPSNSETIPLFTVQEVEVNNLSVKQNARKAAGPYNVSPSTRRSCTDQLMSVFRDFFNKPLQLYKVPLCFKTSVIIPIPNKATITHLNDYRPVVLMSVVMQILEWLILRYLKSVTNTQLNPHQFAYRVNRSVDDHVALRLHYILQHARVLFIDYSSNVNTTVPQKLYNKLVVL